MQLGLRGQAGLWCRHGYGRHVASSARQHYALALRLARPPCHRHLSTHFTNTQGPNQPSTNSLHRGTVIFGYEQANKYTVYDETGAIVALVAEDYGGLGKEIGRQLLRTRRSFTSTVFSADGESQPRVCAHVLAIGFQAQDGRRWEREGACCCEGAMREGFLAEVEAQAVKHVDGLAAGGVGRGGCACLPSSKHPFSITRLYSIAFLLYISAPQARRSCSGYAAPHTWWVRPCGPI